MLKPDIDWILAKTLKIVPPFFVVLFLFFLTYRYLYCPDIFFASDFCHYWVAGRLAMAGEPTAVYDFARLQAFGQAVGGLHVKIPWFNTPTFLMLVLPFSLVPYHAALFLWILTTLVGYLIIIRRLAPLSQFTWLALAFPSTLLNISYGQNGFLSVIFLGGGLVLLDRSPIAAGIFLGLMTFKPQFALLIPIALAAGRLWRTLSAMLVTSGALIGATALLFGMDVWGAFLQKIMVMIGGLKGGQISAAITLPLEKMPTVLSAMKLIGADFLTAAVVQVIVGLAIVAIVGWTWHSKASPAIRSAILVLGTFLVTPYAFVYDNILIAIALACLGWEGYTKGWLPGEKICLFFAWITPIYLSFDHGWLLIVPTALLLIIAIRRMRSVNLVQ
jgi:alpha-1,2-mannosyltransferase